jgi:integrase
LVAEGKIRQYLKPYATRATWITLQIEAGIPIKNIAKAAGNSPEVIQKHYESIHPHVDLAPEI